MLSPMPDLTVTRLARVCGEAEFYEQLSTHARVGVVFEGRELVIEFGRETSDGAHGHFAEFGSFVSDRCSDDGLLGPSILGEHPKRAGLGDIVNALYSEGP